MFAERSCALSKTAHIQCIISAKWRKSTISFVMSICPSVRIELGSRYTDFVEFYVWGFATIGFENSSMVIT